MRKFILIFCGIALSGIIVTGCNSNTTTTETEVNIVNDTGVVMGKDILEEDYYVLYIRYSDDKIHSVNVTKEFYESISVQDTFSYDKSYVLGF